MCGVKVLSKRQLRDIVSGLVVILLVTVGSCVSSNLSLIHI